MVELWTRLHQPDAVLMLFVAALCLLAYAYPGYKERVTAGFAWFVFLAVGIFAVVEWVILVFL
jgi:S-adenosylmethionine:tRNA-ribosyltransferase-isomerase (queuine synthetase)